MLFNYQVDAENSHKALGQMLRLYRLRSGYSLRDLGQVTNISHTLIANIEQGKVNGSNSTLRELFQALNITYYDTKELLPEFKDLYEKLFDNLYKYEFTRAKQNMKDLLENEMNYVHSTLVTDYGQIKFLYNVMMNEEPEDQYVSIQVHRNMLRSFSDRQRQIYYLTEGINQYNKGMYTAGIDYLKKGLKVGDSTLDYLIKVYLIKCYVKRYQFMDVVQTGSEVIDFFENQIIYLRAMEVRLSIAYSYMLVRKYNDAEKLLENVYDFSKNFNAIYLIKESELLLAKLRISQEKYDEASKLLNQYPYHNSSYYFLQVNLAYQKGAMNQVEEYYKKFKDEYSFKKLIKEEIIMDMTVHEMGLIDLNEKEYVSMIDILIEVCEEACDIEIIDLAYNFIVRYYKNKRMYKKAVEASERARDLRRYGCLK